MPKAKDKKTKREHDSDSSSYDDSEDSDSYSSSGSDSDDYKVVKKKKVTKKASKKEKKDKKKAKKKEKKKAKNKISKEDYYSKSREFRIWLMEEKKKSLDELKSSKSKEYFKKFVKKWNSGKLLRKYYKGIDFADEKASLTKYKWKFAEKLSSQPSFSRGLDESVSMSPFKTPQPTRFSTFGKGSFRDKGSQSVPPDAKFIGPARPPPMSQLETDNKRDEERRRMQKERKDFRSFDKMVMEELAPKATGREAKIEKRLKRAQDRRERESSPGLEVEKRSIMGGPNYDDVMARRRQKKEDKKDNMIHKANMKLTEYQLKEQAKMKQLMEMAKANKSKDALW